MATVYLTYVFPDGRVGKFSGETVKVGDLTYVKRQYLDELQPSAEWYPTREAADMVAAIELEKKIAEMQKTVDSLRPLPAVAAADSSAAGRAQAVVAT
jgi:hypothetical protein